MVPCIVLILRTVVPRGRLLFRRHYHHIQPKPVLQPSDSYDIFHCPEVPPENYPREYPILDVLGNWNVTLLVPPKTIYQGICVFDVTTASKRGISREDIENQIQNYRAAEVPFVVRNDPAVLQSVDLWNRNGYLARKLQGKRFEATLSNTTIVTFFNTNPEWNNVPEQFVSPTRDVPMTYAEWYTRAQQSTSSSNKQQQQEYAYLRLDACLPDKNCDSTYRGNPNELDDADFIYNDLPFFHPNNNNINHNSSSSLYPIDIDKARGIQCRFASPGLTAETHFDNERNYIAMLKGERRFLLAHPQNCPHLYLYPPKHPLERHTRVDWSNSNDTAEFPNFWRATINEVVLTAGDVLYLPTYWFHHIVSLTLNYQCNTRSGYSVEYDQTIYDCGFFYDFPDE